MVFIRAILFFFAGLCLSMAAQVEAKTLYLCDDGETILLTDQESRRCPVYRPESELITVPSGSTWTDVEWAVATKQAEVVQSRLELPPTQTAASVDLCEEWVKLVRETQGGFLMGGNFTENTQKWATLSRLVGFLATADVCRQYLRDQPPLEIKGGP